MEKYEKKRLTCSIGLAIILTLCFSHFNLNAIFIKSFQFLSKEIIEFVVNILLNPITITLLIIMLFNKILWKIKWINKILYKVPVISGTWKIKKNDSKSFNQDVNNPTFTILQKDYMHISIKLVTEESSSKSVSAKIKFDAEHDSCELYYIYLNEPKLSERSKSAIHYGSAMFEIKNDWNTLEGSYWTDRDTKNIIILHKIK